jgi:hypothetical protein
MFDTVIQFADWENLSIKAAVYQLLVLGLHYYCVQQLKLEQARLSKRVAEHTEIYSLEDIGRLLTHVGKAKKIMGKEVEPPSNI